MKLIEIQYFLLKANKSNVDCCFVDVSKKQWKSLSNFPAKTSKEKKIFINQKMWNYLTEEYQKYVLLHELGHINDKTSFYSSMAKRELFAQLWTLKKSKSMKLYNVHNLAKKLLGMWEYMYDWNSDHRKFIMASRMAKQQGLI